MEVKALGIKYNSGSLNLPLSFSFSWFHPLRVSVSAREHEGLRPLKHISSKFMNLTLWFKFMYSSTRMMTSVVPLLKASDIFAFRDVLFFQRIGIIFVFACAFCGRGGKGPRASLNQQGKSLHASDGVSLTELYFWKFSGCCLDICVDGAPYIFILCFPFVLLFPPLLPLFSRALRNPVAMWKPSWTSRGCHA